jgi:hypothetical protein
MSAHPERNLWAAVAWLVLVPGATAAPVADPIQGAECKQAVKTLEAKEAELGKPHRPDEFRSQMAPLREAVARICLGAHADVLLPREQVARQPISIRSAATGPAAAARPAGPDRVASPAATRPLTTITSCDALGCWASDGSRLQKVGPSLLGPGGFCNVQGAVVNCP